MKTLSMIKEAWTPNQTIGVTNHLTPVNNIITNINNLFAAELSVVAYPGADNVSVVCTSSFFYDKDTTYKQIYLPIWNDKTSLADYVSQQGLNNIKVIPTGNGQECYVIFCPSDMPQLGYNGCNGTNYNDACCSKEPACESRDVYGDVEYTQFTFEDGPEDPNMNGLKNYGFGDQEIESIQKKDIREILGSKDKVKAAKAFAEILSRNMKLPENYYIKAVRDEDGNESVALRYRYEKRKPFGKTVTLTKTIVNIYNNEENGIWVDDAENLPEEMKGVVDDMLNFVGVRRTGDANTFSISQTDDFDDLTSNSTDDTDNNENNEENQNNDKNNVENNDNENNSDNIENKDNSETNNNQNNNDNFNSATRADGSHM